MKETRGIHNRYEILDQIGRGSYASVHKAINKQTGEICAIKKISTLSSEVTNLITEISIISNCKCKNIVRYLASNCSNEEVLIVMEYCCGGSVKDAMRRLKRNLNAEQIAIILKDVLHGLDYLHRDNKIHRDVKAANILLNEKGVAKLGDFGVSELSSKSNNRKSSIVGTPLWLPPEVIRQENYSFAIDIWSLGITIIEMGDGDPPYSDMEQAVALKEIANYDKPSASFRDDSKWPTNLVDFVALCLEKNASKRKSAGDLLSYDIITRVTSHEPIKLLVAEVCSPTANQTESSLSKRHKSLLHEHIRLCSINEERKKKIIEVDQMGASYSSVTREFDNLFICTRRLNEEVNEKIEQRKKIIDEIRRLERVRNEHQVHLGALKNDGSQKKDTLNKIHEEIQKDLRLNKLKLLEGR